MQDKDVIFPFKVDVDAFPQRRWIRASRLFVYITSFNLILSCVIASLFLFFSNSKITYPTLIYFSDKTNKFEVVHFKPMQTKEEQISLKENLIKSFIADYLNMRYKASVLSAYNEYNWCDCNDGSNKIAIANSAKKRVELKCSLCLMSSGEVYDAFVKNDKPAVQEDLFKYKSVKSVDVVDVMEVFKTEEKFTGNQDYVIYKVYAKINYEDHFKNVVFYIGIEDSIKKEDEQKSLISKFFGSDEKSIPERMNFEPEKYLFKVVSFSQEASIGEKNE